MEEVETYEIDVHWYVNRYGQGSWEWSAHADTKRIGYGHTWFRWTGALSALLAIAEHRANARRQSKTIRKTITRKKA